MSTTLAKEPFIQSLHPLTRIGMSLVITGGVFMTISHTEMSAIMRLLIVWDVFAFIFLSSGWLVLFTRNIAQIRRHAKQEDGSKLFVYVIVVLSSFASMVTVLELLLSRDAKDGNTGYIPVAVLGMLLSWILVHTTFTFHYAHIYYDDDNEDKTKIIGGLNFPGEKNPDYIDFAYFSFVIGMTFQVSDVNITSRKIRRTALLHGLLSFVLNTFVVALTVNLIAGLKG